MGLIATYTMRRLDPVYDPANALCHHVTLPAGVTYLAGQVLGELTDSTANNDVQTLGFDSASSGTFRLVFAGQTTSALAYNATAAAIQAALEALSTVGTGNVAVANGSDRVITFQGKLASLRMPTLTIINSTDADPTITHTTPGNPGGGLFMAYDDGESDGREVAKALLQYDVTVDTYGNVTWGGGEHQESSRSAPAYFCGTFRTKDLTGLDANGVADLGRLIAGTTSTLTADRTIIRIG